MILLELLEGIDFEADCELGADIENVEIDSRRVKKGTLFICIQGLTSDGHDFAIAAQKNGAIAVVCQRKIEGLSIPCVIVKDSRFAMAHICANFYGRPADSLKLLGVTGTNGKTTVTHLIAEILRHTGCKVGVIGTAHNIIDDVVETATMTTPDPMDLHKLFRRMADAGCEYVVMEVSSHSLALNKLTGCVFEVGAFTNLTQDHLDFHKTMEAYLVAKSKLLDISKKSVININDPAGRSLNTKNCLTVGVDEPCGLRCENLSVGSKGLEFDCVYNGRAVHISMNMPGLFNVFNGLVAMGVCLQAGFDIESIAQGINSAAGVKGRVEVVPCGMPYTVLLDYAHTPDALENVLNAIRGISKGRIIALFGCGGDRDKSKRPLMGKIAAELADFCIVTSDNPRSEEPCEIINQIVAGMDKNAEYTAIENRFEAIKYALQIARKDDIILLAGKGHETYQVFRDETIDFDEREVVRRVIYEMQEG